MRTCSKHNTFPCYVLTHYIVILENKPYNRSILSKTNACVGQMHTQVGQMHTRAVGQMQVSFVGQMHAPLLGLVGTKCIVQNKRMFVIR